MGVIREDLKAEGINKIFSLAMLKAFIASPTTRYLIWFRLGSYMHGKKRWMFFYPIVYFFHRHLQYKTGIQIRLRTKIGGGLRFVHFGDVVLNASASLGKNCIVFNGVTWIRSLRRFSSNSWRQCSYLYWCKAYWEYYCR